ncbi:MAG: 4-(cytidine 5'-diphospho)-2-C-methyl-D-erythritol kinase [Candidatus Zixiibacteriota bacterium]|nr:MAG: 4-(cytidine 5'-diphospho)-2-C-methyl-D-erythritol kinase [candidate division Zixibacteria bacterium]
MAPNGFIFYLLRTAYNRYGNNGPIIPKKPLDFKLPSRFCKRFRFTRKITTISKANIAYSKERYGRIRTDNQVLVERISEDSVSILTPAKVNLCLEVLNRREDGYHNINSIFQAVSLYDRVVFRVLHQKECRLELAREADLPVDGRNLITKAYVAIRDRFDLESGLEVYLEKNIPVAGGLGGGSSDAAATIRACNILFDLHLDRAGMSELGLAVGSDVPFFFSGGQAAVTGRGDHVHPISLPTDYWMVLITPPFGISSAESYAGLKRGLTMPAPDRYFSIYQGVEQLLEFLARSRNDFESVHLASHPELGRIKDGLLASGANFCRMSGSGPTFFGIYSGEPDRSKVRLCCQDCWQVNYAQPVCFGGKGN